MLKLVLDAGHAGFGKTPGKRTPAGEYEWDFNNKQLLACQRLLEQCEGINILRVDDPSGRRDVPLEERTDKSNSFGANAYVSFHNNALDDVWGEHDGMETFSYVGPNPKSEKLQKCIHEHLKKATKNRDRGMKKANFHVLRETEDCAAVLCESFFMDSVNDIKKLRNDRYLKETGEAIALGIIECYSLQFRNRPIKMTDQSKDAVKGHWAESSIQKVKNKGIMNGHIDGSWGPNDPVTRGQLAVILDRMGLLE
jgi:N-acetylmuramoyl-L-alanine amidase